MTDGALEGRAGCGLPGLDWIGWMRVAALTGRPEGWAVSRVQESSLVFLRGEGRLGSSRGFVYCRAVQHLGCAGLGPRLVHENGGEKSL